MTNEVRYTTSGYEIPVEETLDQASLAKLFDDLTPTFIERFILWFGHTLCPHEQYMLTKYKLVRSLNPKHINTTLEYQYIRLNPSGMHWTCVNCGKNLGAFGGPVKASIKLDPPPSDYTVWGG